MTTEVDNYLEHYGVKGMKWGKRSTSSDSTVGSTRSKTRKELRTLNREARAQRKTADKASREKARKEYDDNIENARNRVDDDARKYNEAKKQYKVDKHTMGKVAAKEILKKHENQFVDSWNTATLATTKEQHAQLFVAAGSMLLSAAVVGAASRY